MITTPRKGVFPKSLKNFEIASFSFFLEENITRWAWRLLKLSNSGECENSSKIARQVIFQCIFSRKFGNKYFFPENTLWTLFSFYLQH